MYVLTGYEVVLTIGKAQVVSLRVIVSNTALVRSVWPDS